MSPTNCIHLCRKTFLILIVMAHSSGALAAGNLARGAAIFRQCQMCHSLEKDVNGEGPSLYRIVGRPAGSIADYAYSDAIRNSAAKGLVWTADNLVQYLANPHQFLVNYLGDANIRNKMIFSLANDQDRQDVVAYLQSLPPN